jgi:hypothetical protein
MPPLPPCESRRVDAGTGLARCEAAGGASLGEESGEQVRRICGSCSVPEALASEWACLHLVAWAEVGDERAHGRFACRFFHTLYDRPWDDTVTYHGCPHWFPRPVLEKLKDHRAWVERMKRFYTSEGQRGRRESRRQEIGDWGPRPSD